MNGIRIGMRCSSAGREPRLTVRSPSGVRQGEEEDSLDRPYRFMDLLIGPERFVDSRGDAPLEFQGLPLRLQDQPYQGPVRGPAEKRRIDSIEQVLYQRHTVGQLLFRGGAHPIQTEQESRLALPPQDGGERRPRLSLQLLDPQDESPLVAFDRLLRLSDPLQRVTCDHQS